MGGSSGSGGVETGPNIPRKAVKRQIGNRIEIELMEEDLKANTLLEVSVRLEGQYAAGGFGKTS